MQETWVQFLGWKDPLKEESLPVLWPGEFAKSQARLSDFHFSFPRRWARPFVQFSGLSSSILSSTHDARYWMLGTSALGLPRGMVWGGRREEGSGWGTHVYLWRIHFDIWQN